MVDSVTNRGPGHLFTSRKRYVSPFALIEGLLPALRALCELLDGISNLTQDDRWGDAAAKMRSARDALLEPTEAEKKLRERAREAADVDAVLAALRERPELRDELVKPPPLERKPQVRVVLRDLPKLLAARTARRSRR